MLRYAITGGSLGDSGDEKALRNLLERSGELAAKGVDFILVREKQLAAGALVSLCRRIEAAAGKARVLVSGRADVALAAGLDGVHLSAHPGELTPAQVRRVMPAAWVSVSCHTADEVRRAVAGGADAVLFGPVFGKMVGWRRGGPRGGAAGAGGGVCRGGLGAGVRARRRGRGPGRRRGRGRGRRASPQSACFSAGATARERPTNSDAHRRTPRPLTLRHPDAELVLQQGRTRGVVRFQCIR